MKPLHVLILEDNDSDLELLLYQLRKAGFDPVWQQAATGADFTTKLDSTFDLILADYQLPGYNGLQALRLLKARQLDLPFILISGTIGEELAVTMMREGAADYLLKDRLTRLGPAIDHALEARRLRHQKGQFESALLESEQRYRRLVENSPDGIAIQADMELVYINSAGARIIGASDPTAILGKSIFDFVHPAYREAVRLQLAQVGHGESTALLEAKSIRLDDHIIDVEISAIPLTQQDGSAFQVIFRDVTERKRAEAQLQQAYQAVHESEARFRATFEQAAVGIDHTALDGQFLRVNQKFCDIVGYTRQELLQLTFQEITHPDDLAQSQLQVHRLLAGEVETCQLEKRYLHKNRAPIWANVTVSLARAPSGEPLYFIVVVEDITERRLLEQQFYQSQKMEAIGQLAGGIAHDFNNLLTAIIGYGELTMRELPEHPVRGHLQEIQESAHRAAGLTRQLLAFSRQQVLQPRLLDLNTVVMNVENLLRRLIGEDIDFATHLAPDLWPVKADPGQLEQVLTNLAVNARDAMPAGGRLRIETANVELDEAQARLYAETEPGPYAQITLSDTGQGMDAATQARIFEPFFTTKEVGKGTGLGLSTTHGIISQSGGHIGVVSELGLGTTFEIYLPRADLLVTDQLAPQDQASQPDRVPLAEGQLGGYTILVVEDEVTVCDLIGRILTRVGYTFLVAHDGTEALQLCQGRRTPIDLLLADLTLPGDLNGYQLAQQLRLQYPQLEILYTSGYPDQSMIHDDLLETRAAFIPKPFTPQELLDKLEQLLAAATDSIANLTANDSRRFNEIERHR